MVRKTNIRRDSKPKPHELFQNQKQKAELEARNGLRQFDEVIRLINEIERGKQFILRPSIIQSLHRIAIHDIYTCAGNYRTDPIYIHGTDHTPPAWEDVSRFVEELCDYVNDRWMKETPIHLSSYVMWRINWIHPFAGGNGRTSRAVSYLVLCAKLGYRLPGTLTIPDQIVTNRQPYYQALDDADAAALKNIIDVTTMEILLSTLLAKQLTDIHRAATHEL
jgi:Fic family protein